MQLIICEKPKVAQTLAEALSEGKLERKRAHDINYYLLERAGKEIAIASAVGHIYSLEESGKGKSYSYPVFEVGWKKAYEVDKGADYTRNYIELLEELAQKADEFIVACDYDIEGSLIGYNVVRFACNSTQGKRMKFSALTREDLIEAYENMEELDYKNAQAGEARHMLDWFWGINLSRALMGALKRAGTFRIMSIGRVQGPALSILAKKEDEISAFKSTPYWQLFFESKKTTFMHEKEKFEVKEEAQRALSATGKEGKVVQIERKEYAQKPPFPFDLTSLQVEAHGALHIDPKRTLELAQTLYESSLISYPRTSSQKLSSKLRLPQIIEKLSKNPKYSLHAGKLLSEKRFAPNEGKKEDPAHPAIHPTGLGGSMGVQEEKLYDLIVRRFLSTFAQDARRESQKVAVDSNGEKYIASGNRTVFEGWFEIYKPYLKLEEVTLPPFSEGERINLENLRMEEKKTKPPKRYTPASIISALEKVKLGTKATRASIVETLFKRGYVGGKQIEVTPFGMSLYRTLSKNVPEILDAEMTRNIEEEMEKIQLGEIEEGRVIEDGKEILSKTLEHFVSVEETIGKTLSSGLVAKRTSDSLLGKCSCGGDLRSIISRAKKRFVGCSNYPNCTLTYPLPQEGKIEPLGSACEKCKTPQIKVTRKGRRPFLMCLLPTCETKKDWGKPKNTFSAQKKN